MFFKFVILLLLSRKLLGETDDADKRIINGKDAPDGFAPYIVSMRLNRGKSNKHFCGGSIIHEEWVLTAAHCIESLNRKEITIVAGSNKLSSGGDHYKVKKLIPHERYSDDTLKNDIGLVQVDSKIAFKEKVKKIKMEKEHVPAGTKCLLTGWGYTNLDKQTGPNNLQMQDYTTASIKDCSNKLKGIGDDFLPLDEQLQTCVMPRTGEGGCTGDSGGPLVSTDKEPLLIGVVSFGISCAKDYPDVFAAVAGYRDWVKKNMK